MVTKIFFYHARCHYGLEAIQEGHHRQGGSGDLDWPQSNENSTPDRLVSMLHPTEAIKAVCCRSFKTVINYKVSAGAITSKDRIILRSNVSRY